MVAGRSLLPDDDLVRARDTPMVRPCVVLRGVGLVLPALFLMACGVVALRGNPVLGWDSHAYWVAWHRPHLYEGGPMTRDAFLYSPAFAHVVRPLALLPWPVFSWLWSGALAVVLAWMLLPLRWWAVPLFVAGLPEIVAGNVFIVLALCTVWAARRPGAWAFAGLTKVTVCLGPVWYLARREWKPLASSALTIAVVTGLSVAISPAAWGERTHFLFEQSGGAGRGLGAVYAPPLVLRLPFALALVVWGARSDRPWVLPLGMVLASPVLWLGTLCMLAAIPRVAARVPRPHPVTADPSGSVPRMQRSRTRRILRGIAQPAGPWAAGAHPWSARKGSTRAW